MDPRVRVTPNPGPDPGGSASSGDRVVLVTLVVFETLISSFVTEELDPLIAALSNMTFIQLDDFSLVDIERCADVCLQQMLPQTPYLQSKKEGINVR